MAGRSSSIIDNSDSKGTGAICDTQAGSDHSAILSSHKADKKAGEHSFFRISDRDTDKNGIDAINNTLAGDDYRTVTLDIYRSMHGGNGITGNFSRKTGNPIGTELYPLPYGAQQRDFHNIFRDTQQAQLLFFVREVQEILTDRSRSLAEKLEDVWLKIITSTEDGSSRAIQFSWQGTQLGIKFQSFNEKLLTMVDSFITRGLCLFTLPENQIIEHCHQGSQRVESENLFEIVARESSVENLEMEIHAKAFVVKHFFNQLEIHQNILTLIRQIDDILNGIADEYAAYLKEKKLTTDAEAKLDSDQASATPRITSAEIEASSAYLRMNFLLMAGVYFAVLPEIKNTSAVVDQYQLNWSRDELGAKSAGISVRSQPGTLRERPDGGIKRRASEPAMGLFPQRRPSFFPRKRSHADADNVDTRNSQQPAARRMSHCLVQ